MADECGNSNIDNNKFAKNSIDVHGSSDDNDSMKRPPNASHFKCDYESQRLCPSVCSLVRPFICPVLFSNDEYGRFNK